MRDRLISIIKSVLSYLGLVFDYRKSTSKEVVVLVGHSALESGGAPVVLYELGKEFSKNYEVIFMSKRDGNLINICKQQGIHSYVYGYIPKLFFSYLEKKVNVKLYLVNTIVCGECIEILQEMTRRPVYWWLHENEEIYEIMNDKLPNRISDNVDVRCVSESAQVAFNLFYPNNSSRLMAYGMPDISNKVKHNNDNSIWRVLSVGQIVERKNYLVLLDVWDMFIMSTGADAELTIIGSGVEKDDYYLQFLKRVKITKNVKHIEFIPREKMKDMYSLTDAFICVSKSDPLPVVISEAFMYCIPCIVANGVGQYKMVEDRINGYACVLEDKQSIVDALVLAYNNRDDTTIGCNGRKIYEEYFSIQSVVNSILDSTLCD